MCEVAVTGGLEAQYPHFSLSVSQENLRHLGETGKGLDCHYESMGRMGQMSRDHETTGGLPDSETQNLAKGKTLTFLSPTWMRFML